LSPKTRSRVLFVISKMGIGGAQQVVLELINGLAQKGFQIDLCVFFRTPEDASVIALLDDRVEFVTLLGEQIELEADHRGFLRKLFFLLAMPVRILKGALKGVFIKYDAVHTNLLIGSFFSYSLRGILQILKKTPPVFVETYHADLTSTQRLEKNIFYFLWKGLDVLVLELRKKDIQTIQKKFSKVRVEYIPFGISLIPDKSELTKKRQDFIAKYDELSLDTSPLNIVSITRLNNSEKRVNKLIDLIKHLHTDLGSPFRFILCGDGPDRKEIEKQIIELDISNFVIQTGFVDDPFQPLSIATVFLQIGIEDRAGIAALQAASIGVPVVTVQGDSEWKIRANDNELFYTSSSMNELVAHMKKLLLDNNYHKLESERNKRVVEEEFMADAMVDRYFEVYLDILASLPEKKDVEKR
jgi:glycosyltransferase involved in cell wall biosynthesis